MVLNSFLMIRSGLLRGLDDFLTVYWECLMNNCGRSLLRAEWSRTARKLTSWLFGILLVQIRIVGQGPKQYLLLLFLMIVMMMMMMMVMMMMTEIIVSVIAVTIMMAMLESLIVVLS